MSNYLFMTEVTQPVLVKDGNLFFLASSSGDVWPNPNDGLGLFCNDTRYLNRYELRLGGRAADSLMSSSAAGCRAVLQLTNPKLQLGEAGIVSAQAIGIKVELSLDMRQSVLLNVMSFMNFTQSEILLPVSLLVATDFEDIFALRGTRPRQRGECHAPRLNETEAIFRYDGADEVTRLLEVRWSPSALLSVGTDGVVGRCTLALEPQVPMMLEVSFRVTEERMTRVRQPKKSNRNESSDCSVAIESDSARLDEAINRSLRDLRLLCSDHGGGYIAAGVPWFAVPFGRDSIIGALQCLIFQAEVAADTARLLARHQGRKQDQRTGEQPGKILHELRLGEMAHLGEIPHTPSYASIDSTPLFLILVASYIQWTGDFGLFDALRRNVDAALAWIDHDGDANRDGYLEYGAPAKNGFAHHGWKDSGLAIIDKDGAPAVPPISLVEVQGYVYMAKSMLSDIYRQAGAPDVADRLEQEAAKLRERFNRDFWMEDEGCYCLALQGEGRQASVVTSNAGHALWSGIADERKARQTAARLMQLDMFNGWGIRSLSSKERAYNPILYHMGSVWPFDNALIVAGFCRYGLADAARRVFAGMLDAASHFAYGRLPEFFIGFDRESDVFPGRCPTADTLQAWSSGALPFMLQALLGLKPNAAERQLRIVHPILPEGVNQLSVRRLAVGDASIDLRFENDGQGAVSVDILQTEGDLSVAFG